MIVNFDLGTESSTVRTVLQGRIPTCLTVGFLPFSVRGPIEDGVNYVEGNHSRADDGAGGHSAPKDVRPGEIPDCQQASDNRHQDAAARGPEGDLSNYTWIEEASSRSLSWVLRVHGQGITYCSPVGAITRSARTAPSSVTAVKRNGRCRVSSPTHMRICNLSGCGSSVVSDN